MELKNKGLTITFNLSDITKEQLQALRAADHAYDDEVVFPIPEAWKKISIPLLSVIPEPLNDPEAKELQINFLHRHALELKEELPIRVFYPLKYSETISPQTYSLATNQVVQERASIFVLKLPLFVHNVSKLFLDIVKDNIEIDLVAAPKTEREKLEWGIVFIDDVHLENMYVAFSFNSIKNGSKSPEREKYFRKRFRAYKHKFALYLANQHPLDIEGQLEDHHVIVQIPQKNAQPQTIHAH